MESLPGCVPRNANMAEHHGLLRVCAHLALQEQGFQIFQDDGAVGHGATVPIQSEPKTDDDSKLDIGARYII
eukprot:889142-Pyramimonas_sp.AAC.1